jgi:hypothetical protein
MGKHHTRKHGRRHHKKGGALGFSFLDGPAFETNTMGSGPQQLNYIQKQAFGPANPDSALLPANPPKCLFGGKKHRKSHKKAHKKSHKKSHKKHRKSKRKGGKRTTITAL